MQHRVDDRASAGAAGHQDDAAVADDDGRRHARQHPFARLGQVGPRADQTGRGGQTRTGVEVAHFVVQQKPGARNDDLRAVGLLQGRGQRHGVPFRVHHRQVRRLLTDRRPFKGVGPRDRGALRADGRAQARGVGLRRQPVHRHRAVEVGVAQVAGAVGEGAAHRFRDAVHVGRRAVAGGAQIPAFEHVQHLHQRHPAGARRRHRQHRMAAVGAPDRLAHPRRVGGQIRRRDESVVVRHLARQQLGGAPGVEAGRSLLRNPLQCRRQVRLAEAVAGRVRRAGRSRRRPPMPDSAPSAAGRPPATRPGRGTE